MSKSAFRSTPFDARVNQMSTLSPGMGFGELGMLSGGSRSATVRADTAVECARLDAPAF